MKHEHIVLLTVVDRIMSTTVNYFHLEEFRSELRALPANMAAALK